ncbi:hypothetical protein OA105_02285 [Prochlorococcus sp. AH-736-B08]|nr:hypothetical protein [Prochlorococcus sp. AH-736-B08]
MSIKFFGVFEAMTKDLKSGNVTHLPFKNIDLPSFVNNSSGDNPNICSIEGTNVIRVPFGKKFSKKKRPEKNQNIATLILPLTSYSNPTPPHVA